MAGTCDVRGSDELLGLSVGGRYNLQRRLGEGTFGEVYLALDLKNRWRSVAVKLIRKQWSTEVAQQRFQAESIALELLQGHPNIMMIIERGLWIDRNYIVAEYIAGESLEARLNRLRTTGQTLAMQEIVDIFTQICAGIEAAHHIREPGPLIHRDLKPSNIMLESWHTQRRRVKILDFGVARLGHEGQTHPGEIVGTYGYMPPEQMRGSCDEIGPWTDVYALGAILRELLTLRPAGAGEQLHTLQEVANEQLPRAEHSPRTDIPAALWNVVQTALCADYRQRFQDVQSLRSAFEAVVASRRINSAWALPRSIWPGKQWLVVAGLFFITCITVMGATLRFPPSPPTGPGAVLLISPHVQIGRHKQQHELLCEALRKSNPENVCDVLPPLLGRLGSLHSWIKASGAALAIVEGAPGELQLLTKSSPQLPLGMLQLQQNWSAPTVNDSALKHLATVLSVLASLHEDGDRRGYVPPDWRVAAMPLEPWGEQVSILTAYVRWAYYGTAAPGANSIGDPEVEVLREAARRCNAQPGTKSWTCLMAMFLYPVRSSSEQSLPYLLTLARDGTIPASVRSEARLHGARQYCKVGKLDEALEMLEGMLGSQNAQSCQVLEHIDSAACIALHPQSGALPAEKVAWLHELAMTEPIVFQHCDKQLLRINLGRRGQFLMRAGRWAAAEKDFATANRIEPHPSYLLNRAESLLHIPERCAEASSVLSWETLKQFKDVQQLRAAYFRWLATGEERDAGAILVAYLPLDVGQTGLNDSAKKLRELTCHQPDSVACEIYHVLIRPKLPDSTPELEQVIRKLKGQSDRPICAPRSH